MQRVTRPARRHVSLTELSVAQLRCVEHAQLAIPSGLTLLYGPNGSGKTSVLEAMFILGRGRSFRTRNNERLIRYGQDHFRVTGRVTHAVRGTESLGFEFSRRATTARIGGRPAGSMAELSQAFAVQVIDPGVHRLVEEGGHRRRRWLDWGVFHVEPQFMDTWLRYGRALKQRNAALKVQGGEVTVWDPELARLGESIALSRQELMSRLQPYWREEVGALTGLEVDLHYLRGWNQESSLLEALEASRSRDQARQMTNCGPHRGDVAVRLQGRPAREVLSRGQQKLVAVAMTIAQLRLLMEGTQLVPTLLLDDPAAELDADRLQSFIARVASLRCQLVVTSLQSESRLFGTPERTFRLEQGRVEPV
jgi:DNA replication and repair protein RecF